MFGWTINRQKRWVIERSHSAAFQRILVQEEDKSRKKQTTIYSSSYLIVSTYKLNWIISPRNRVGSNFNPTFFSNSLKRAHLVGSSFNQSRQTSLGFSALAGVGVSARGVSMGVSGGGAGAGIWQEGQRQGVVWKILNLPKKVFANGYYTFCQAISNFSGYSFQHHLKAEKYPKTMS